MLKSSTLSRRAILHARAGLGPAVAVAAMLSLTAAAHSHSSTPHPFKSASIQWDPGGGGRPAPPSLLVGHDGEDYTHLVGEISTRFRLKAKVKSGNRIYGFGITTGDPDMADNIPDDLMGFKRGTYKKSLDWHATFAMDAAKAVTTGTPGIALNRVEEIVDMCNSAFNVPPPTDRPAGSIELTVHGVFSRGDWKGATFASWTGWYPDGATSRPAYAHTTFPVNVVCLNRTDPRVGELTPKPISVDIRVKQKGETCPKDTEVTAYIDYDRPATARFRIIHNGVEPKSAPIEIKARKVSFAGKTWYRVERMERYKLDPGKHTFQVKVLGEKLLQAKTSPKQTITVACPPFKVTSAWLNYDVEDKQTCKKQVDEKAVFYANRPGDIPYRVKTQGGLVVTQGIAYAAREGDKYVARRARTLSMGAFDQMMQLEVIDDPSVGDQKPLKVECLEVLSGTLDLRGFKASRCEGEAAFSIRTNMAGDVPYQLDCTGGRSWKGKVEAHQTGPNTYIGVGTKRFDVSNNEHVNCALKTGKPLPYKVLALKGRKYECHKTTGVSGTNDLAPDPGRPDDDLPQGSTLKGDFGFVDHGSPKCPRRGKALLTFRSPKADNVHYSLDCKFFSKSGVTAVKPHPDGGYVGAALVSFDVDKTVDESCTLRTVAPYGPKEHVTKGRLFQCVTPTTPPATTDLTPETRPDPQGPRNPGNVIVAPPRPVVDPPRGSSVVADPVRPDKNGNRTDSTPDYGKKTRHDAEADKRRLEELRKKRAEEARKKAEAERKRREAAAKAKREAAKKAAREVKAKREAAKKAAELKRKRDAAIAARKARELKLKLDAAKKARVQRKVAPKRKSGGNAAARRRAPAPMKLNRRR